MNYNKTKSDLLLLDYTALLLVAGKEHDVAAVAMEQLPNALNFYYSKNSPSSSKFQKYLGRLTTLCASAESDTFMRDFLTEVFRVCAGKVRNRVGKIQKEIKELETIVFNHEIAAKVPEAATRLNYWKGKTFGEIIEGFLKKVAVYDPQPHKGGSIIDSMILSL